MSEARMERTRRTLPEGYQFGDAATIRLPVCAHDQLRYTIDAWVCKCGLRLNNNTSHDYWNVIEGEPV